MRKAIVIATVWVLVFGLVATAFGQDDQRQERGRSAVRQFEYSNEPFTIVALDGSQLVSTGTANLTLVDIESEDGSDNVSVSGEVNGIIGAPITVNGLIDYSAWVIWLSDNASGFYFEGVIGAQGFDANNKQTYAFRGSWWKDTRTGLMEMSNLSSGADDDAGGPR